MDKKFLHKVIDQLVRETTVLNSAGVIESPFFSHISIYNFFTFSSFSPLSSFIEHCREVYGLNAQEIKYVWKEYKETIKDKINYG